jgi:hypothetical protein
MAHVRQQIRDAVATAIAGNGVTVEKSRQWPINESEFPRYLVYSLREQMDESQSTRNGLMRNLEIVVEAVILANPATVDTALDTHAIYLETALNYSTLTGKVLKTVLRSSDILLNSDSDALMGILTLTFDVTYRSLPTNPEVLA